MLADYHVHTEYSDDSVYPMEDVVKDAIDMGLDEICFTDHVDYGIKFDWDCGQEIQYRDGNPFANVDYPRYMDDIHRLQEAYKDRITIRTGLEFGIQTHTIPQFCKLYDRYAYDFIIEKFKAILNSCKANRLFHAGRRRLTLIKSVFASLHVVI